MENKQLPEGLKNHFNRIQDGVKQWSQIVAWSWTDYLAFKDDGNKSKQEENLKKLFIRILQEQARYSYAVSSYGDEGSKPNAYQVSLKIKKIVMGKNDEIDELKEAGVTLTLPEIYEKLTEQQPESLSDETFMEMFHVEIVTDSFSGYIRDASDAEKAEIKDFIGDEDVQYIIYLAYPPCPAFGKATVTEKQLEDWMQGKNEDGEPVTDYLPPSAYIPVSMS
jgi:hypothetical protein